MVSTETSRRLGQRAAEFPTQRAPEAPYSAPILFQKQAGQFGVLHFATHAVASDGQPFFWAPFVLVSGEASETLPPVPAEQNRRPVDGK